MAVLAAITTLCTALCLGNLFDGLRWWLLPSAGAIALAAAVGEVARRLSVPSALLPLIYLVAGWLYVIPIAAHGDDIGAHISLAPTGSTFSGLRMLADSAAEDIRTLSVPVPERPGFLLLTVAGVFLVAAAVDALVGVRRTAAAGLPLLALLAVPAAITPRGVGLLAFIAACVSFVLLLLAAGRRELVGWARLPSGGAAGIRRSTGSAGRRIGVVSLALALALPVVIPRFTGIARHHRGGGGSASATVIEPVVTLNQQLHSGERIPLLTVRTTSPEYLRLTALEHFDGRSFTLGSLSAGSDAKVSRGLPAPAGGKTKTVQATINVLPVLHQHYLPFAFQPTKVTIAGDWRLASGTFTVFSSQTDTSGVHYTVTSQVAEPTATELRSQSVTSGAPVPADVQPSLQLPKNIPPAVARLTEDTVAAAKATTEYDKVAAIQAFLRSGAFTYDLQGAPVGPNALAEFLLTDRRGYCEQFAGAMTVMLRQLGIPARVAVGFTPGQLEPDGSYLVTNKDAHSWPEVWFPQAGWVRFEPTPRDLQTEPPAYTVAPPDASSPTPTPLASNDTQPKTQPTPHPKSSDQATAAPSATGGTGGGGSGLWAAAGWTALGLFAVALLLAPAAARRQRRAGRLREGRATPTRQWTEILDTARDLGLPIPETLSPGRTVAHWSYAGNGERLIPENAARVLREAAQNEQAARYAADAPVSAVDAQRLRTALRSWEHAYGSAARWRAAVMPRSVLQAATFALVRQLQPLGTGVRTLLTLAGRRLRSRRSTAAEGR
jgi:transglutaminase-like putative cysteine protease